MDIHPALSPLLKAKAVGRGLLGRIGAALLYVVLVVLVIALVGSAVWVRASRTKSAHALIMLTGLAVT